MNSYFIIAPLLFVCGISVTMVIVIPTALVLSKPNATYTTALPEEYTPRCTNDEMGQDFVVAFMENKFYDPNYNLEIYPSTELRGVNIEVDAYLNQSAGIQQLDSFQLGPRQMHIVEVPSSLQLSGTEQALKSVRISSSQKIGIYAMNSINDSCDGFLVLPVQSLGTDYYTISFFPPDQQTDFAIAAAFDDTQVNVTFRLATRPGFTIVWKGTSYTSYFRNSATIPMTLNRNEAAQIVSSTDLTGTHIVSNKPIAAFSGNDYTAVFSGPSPPDYVVANHLVEQLPPTDRWGQLFFLLPVPNSTFDYLVKIVNSVANTNVTITDVDGNINEFTLSNPGDFPSSSIHYNIPVTIRSTAPILVAQFAGSGYTNYPTMIVIPPAERFNSIYTVPTAHSDFTTFFHYLLLIIDRLDLPGLTIDGLQAPQIGWTEFSNDTNIVGTALEIDNGVHTIRQSGDRPVGRTFMGIPLKTVTVPMHTQLDCVCEDVKNNYVNIIVCKAVRNYVNIIVWEAMCTITYINFYIIVCMAVSTVMLILLLEYRKELC